MTNMFDLQKYKEIKELLKKNSRNTTIIAVSKNHPETSIIQALKTGVNIFGENRVLEAKSKFEPLKKIYPNLELHLTGPLQSNKVKDAAKLFDVFHTLDREKIAKEFNKNFDLINNKKMFIQVNTGLEKTKSGIEPNKVSEFIKYCKNDMRLNISGLMCIPPVDEDPNIHFRMLKELLEKNNLQELSIGMSNDYTEAIKFKPSYIRIGTLIFGKRQK